MTKGTRLKEILQLISKVSSTVDFAMDFSLEGNERNLPVNKAAAELIYKVGQLLFCGMLLLRIIIFILR